MALFLLIFPIIFILLYVAEIISSSYCFVFVGIFSGIIIYLLCISLPYLRIAGSQIVFCDDAIEIRDNRGNIWRTIAYEDIVDVQVMDMEGFMHGYHGVSGISKHIFVITGEFPEIKSSNFSEKYFSPGFFPVYYQEEVFLCLQAHLGLSMCRTMAYRINDV